MSHKRCHFSSVALIPGLVWRIIPGSFGKGCAQSLPFRVSERVLTAAREEMFARAYLLKTRTDGPNGPEIPEDFNTPVPGPESGLKSDVEPVSSESEAHTDEREDPNEYLQDLPPEVRFCPHNEHVVQDLGPLVCQGPFGSY